MDKTTLSIEEEAFLKILASSVHRTACSVRTLTPKQWISVMEIARSHNVLALVLEKASEKEEFRVLSSYEQYVSMSMSIVFGQARRTQSFLTLYQSMIEEGIRPIVMKGLICRQLYGEYCDHRPSGDEDILIQKSEFECIKSFLLRKGFLMENSNVTESQLQELQEITFYGDSSDMTLEVHLNPMGHDNDLRTQMNKYFERVFEKSLTIDVDGVDISTMNATDHFMYLVLHAFRHFTSYGFGIRQVLDILLFYQKYNLQIEWSYIKKSLVEVGADKFLGDLIHIGNQYLGFELPVIYKEHCPDELLQDMLCCGVFGNGTQEYRTAGQMTSAAVSNGKKSHFLKVFVSTAFPGRKRLMNTHPELQEKPWLLPVRWVQRWGRFLRHYHSSRGNLASESIKISRRRMELLKKYDII